MRIGFTERGDAGLNLSWTQKLDKVDGAIIITKNAHPKFQEALLAANAEHPGKIVTHIGCTGRGSTWVEPNVPHPTKQLDYAKSLVDSGFPLDHVVLRVDPIIPDEEGLRLASKVIGGAFARGLLSNDGPSARIRVSVYDEYRHVKERLKAQGKPSFYPNDAFYASPKQFEDVAKMLGTVTHGLPVYTCAEPSLAKIGKRHGVNIVPAGCLSTDDLDLMGIDPKDAPQATNAQMRHGCLCLACKQELLTHKRQCPHACVYCYWR